MKPPAPTSTRRGRRKIKRSGSSCATCWTGRSAARRPSWSCTRSRRERRLARSWPVSGRCSIGSKEVENDPGPWLEPATFRLAGSSGRGLAGEPETPLAALGPPGPLSPRHPDTPSHAAPPGPDFLARAGLRGPRWAYGGRGSPGGEVVALGVLDPGIDRRAALCGRGAEPADRTAAPDPRDPLGSGRFRSLPTNGRRLCGGAAPPPLAAHHAHAHVPWAPR